MKVLSLLGLAVGLTVFLGCDPANHQRVVVKDSKSETTLAQQQLQQSQPELAKQAGLMQPVSLKEADSANTASQAFERKIIRNANLTVEVASATDSQRKIVSIAESHKGFVVTSEATQRTADDRDR